MKRTRIATAVTAVASFAFPVVSAVPAYAFSADLAMSADNTASTVPVYFEGSVDCDPGTTSIGPETLAPGDTRGETPACTYDIDHTTTFTFTIGTDEMHAAGTNITCTGKVKIFGRMYPSTFGTVAPSVDTGPGSDSRCVGGLTPDDTFENQPNFVSFELNPAGVFNFQLTSAGLPPTAPPSGTATNSVSLTVGSADLTPDTGTGMQLGTPRAKSISGHVTDQPGRVTAIAKRFVPAPGDVINIHAYGSNREQALSRAKHVREHLQSEITRLGGDPANYPTFVVYGGDPDHKKGVHVTIHQHGASSITVPEGGTLTIGGNS